MNTTKKKKLHNINEILEAKYGVTGTPERQKFTEEAIATYHDDISKEKQSEKQLTQEELERRAKKSKL